MTRLRNYVDTSPHASAFPGPENTVPFRDDPFRPGQSASGHPSHRPFPRREAAQQDRHILHTHCLDAPSRHRRSDAPRCPPSSNRLSVATEISTRNDSRPLGFMPHTIFTPLAVKPLFFPNPKTGDYPLVPCSDDGQPTGEPPSIGTTRRCAVTGSNRAAQEREPMAPQVC